MACGPTVYCSSSSPPPPPSFHSSSEPSFRTTRVLVVDDDPTCLTIVAAILRKFKYQVVTAKTSKDALRTLRMKKERLDLVVSDVHMPEINGFELQQAIATEFNNLPVVLMSVDTALLEERVSSFFLPKPIRAEDVMKLWQFADHSDDHYYTNETKASNKLKCSNLKRREETSRDRPKPRPAYSYSSSKKAKVVWNDELHSRFLAAIGSIGLERSVPKKILEVMNVPGLTRDNIASHLQKYRLFLRRVSEESQKMQYCLAETAGLMRSCNNNNNSPTSFSVLDHPGSSSLFGQFQGLYNNFPGPFPDADRALSSFSNDYYTTLVALARQPQLISSLRQTLLGTTSNITNQDLIMIQHLIHHSNVSLEDFVTSLTTLNSISPTPICPESASSITTPMPLETGFGAALLGNHPRGLDYVDATLSLPNDSNISTLDQLFSEYLEKHVSSASFAASDRHEDEQWFSVVGDNQNVQAPPDSSAVFDNLMSTQSQPLDQEGYINSTLVQDQNGTETMTRSTFHNQWDNNVLPSLDQTTPSQFTSNTILTDPIKSYDDDEFVDSLLASEEP
ncbi:two-component response regulator ORR24-like isoform X2 [Andrographis paniculata]|uniref:two-component response regulator ORR24-like isoform X2 n=1 Tax=Andrographis paniculata TaxID=175694 RepID=UPI0021E7C39F|nr:two-component response regulator ORR24-like isoform X2 [Andrographis paniculata]